LVTQNIADIATNASGIADNVATLAVHEGLVTQNIADIATNASGIADNVATLAVHEGLVTQNISDISANRSHLMRLDEDVDMLRSGIAMSMALAGMPTPNGKGTAFAIGLGNFDGESAVALGLTHQAGKSSYKLGVTHANGETGVSAGMAFKIN
jgi:hypothetical protein